MANLIRMDLRRMVRNKMLLILPLVMLCLMAVCYAMAVTFTSPEILDSMAASGAEISASDYAQGELLRGFTSVDYLQDMLFNGGLWLCMVGFGAGLFAVEDFTSGYSKNIFALMGSRRAYVAARAISLLVPEAVTLAAAFIFTIAITPFSVFTGLGAAGEWVMMYIQGLAVGWAFSMAMQCCAAIFRKSGWMVAAIFIGACGVIPGLLSMLFRLLGAPSLHYGLDATDAGVISRTYKLAYPLIYPQSQVHYADFYPLGLIICLGWVAIYAVITTVVIEKRDVS